MPLADPSIEEPLDLRLPVDSVSVTEARHFTGEFAERAGAPRADVELAVSEAVANSVLHGYPEGPEGTIQVRAEIREGRLLITVRDDGTGLRPNLDGKGLGLGLPMIARLSEEYRIEDAPGGGVLVTMRFRTEVPRLPGRSRGEPSG